jgi:hypothetical protein
MFVRYRVCEVCDPKVIYWCSVCGVCMWCVWCVNCGVTALSGTNGLTD